MTLEDVKDTIDDYVHAAKNAIKAGFDCVEIVSNLPPLKTSLEANDLYKGLRKWLSA